MCEPLEGANFDSSGIMWTVFGRQPISDIINQKKQEVL